jgi:hypothetical protein
VWYGSETWVLTKKDDSRTQDAEMRFVRSVTGYTHLDRMRNDEIRNDLDTFAIKDKI